MSVLPTAGANLKDRFLEEQEYVQKYVEFLQLKTAVFESEIRKIIDSLRRHNLTEIENKRDWKLRSTPYSFTELQRINDLVQPMIPRLNTLINESKREFESMTDPEKLRSVDVRSPQGELIEFMLEALENDLSSENVDVGREDLLEQIRTHTENMIASGEEAIYTDDMVDYAVESAVYIQKSRRLNELENLKSQIDELSITVRMSSPDAEINVLRQGFIVLMTLFDATVFDIMKLALKKDFFKLISTFGKQDKIALKDLSEYATFEHFRDEIIEEQLRSKYLKDLLFIFDYLGVTCVDTSTGDRFIQLIEMVLRRNIHLHNRGRVDEKYLERNDSGAPKYNIYSLALNDMAQIDNNYWEMANRLSRNCVTLAANWADSLP